MANLELVSFDLCPYVQRVAIALMEKDIPFRRTTISLADKPEWFKAISPLGKVPLLRVGETVLFESAPIVEYIEDAYPAPLHPSDPIERARHRAWMDFGSTILADIWTIETDRDEAAVQAKLALLRTKFARIEGVLGAGPYFAGATFSLVDAVFAPIFRYFDVFDAITDLQVFDTTPKVRAWRMALSQRASVRNAVVPDYEARLRAFLRNKNGWLGQQLKAAA